MNWDDGDGASRFFNPDLRTSTVSLPSGHHVLVIDDVLLDPQGLVDWARQQRFHEPSFPYPGLVVPGPRALSARFLDFFMQHARTPLGARRTLRHDIRLSMVSTPPDQLDPRQWQCHRDEVSTDPAILFVGSVLYLFRDPALGGTSFYQPRQSPAATERIIHDSQVLDAQQFSARYGVKPGYMDGGNAYFDCMARVPAAWNRMILYDAGIFHSGDIGRPDLLGTDPATARLTLNGFFSCRRQGR